MRKKDVVTQSDIEEYYKSTRKIKLKTVTPKNISEIKTVNSITLEVNTVKI